MVTRADMTEVLKKLSMAYGMPIAARRDKAAFEDLWLDVLRNVTRHELLAAVDAYTASDAEHWPKPGQLLQRIKRERVPEGLTANDKTYRAWEAAAWEPRIVRDDRGNEHMAWTACPVCAATPEHSALAAGGLPRLRLVHREDAHHQAGIPAIGDTEKSVAMYALTSEQGVAAAAERERRIEERHRANAAHQSSPTPRPAA